MLTTQALPQLIHQAGELQNRSGGFHDKFIPVRSNKIFARKFTSTITERIINDTLFLKEPAKRQVYLGLTGGFDRVNILNYAGPSLLYKDKKDKIFGLGVGINNSKQISLQGSIYWKIKLKK